MLEWRYLEETLGTDDYTSSTGMLSCLCKNYSDEHGMMSTLNVDMFTPLENSTKSVGGRVCHDWQTGHLLMFILDWVITAVIVGADFVLRILVVGLMEWVSFRNLNYKLVLIQFLLFFSQYLNNGLSLMMVGANLDQMIGHVPFLDGDYPDFTSRWFREISAFFVTPMASNILISIIELVLTYTAIAVIRWHDRGFT